MTRQVLSLPCDRGLDRSATLLRVDADSAFDLRNMLPADGGKVRVRPGIGTSLHTLGLVSCHEAYFEAAACKVVVAYDPATRDVDVYKTDLNGHSPVLIDNWGTLATGAVEFPRFSTGESYGYLVLAHDEPSVTNRLQNAYTDAAALTLMTADLDGTGAKAIYFRGVVEHLGYIWYWGFGADNDKNRPEILRPSRPSDPRQIDQTSFTVGARNNAILAARPCADGLAILKGNRAYVLIGSDLASFGVFPRDTTYGTVAMRAAVSVGGGVLYAWTSTGPQRTTNGFFETLKIPLSLQDVLPTGLPTGSALEACHAHEWPDMSGVVWFFPDSTTGETLAFFLATGEGQLRWSYQHFSCLITSAAYVAPSTESAVVAPGYSSATSHSGVQVDTDYVTKITVTHASYVGDEVIEVWGKQGADPYGLLTTTPIVTSAATQAISVHVTAAGSWDLAVRYTRNGQPRTNHTGDPSTWLASALATGTVTALPALVPNAPTYTAGASISTGTWGASWNTPVSGAAVQVYIRAFEEGPALAPGTLIGFYTVEDQLVTTTAANATSVSGVTAEGWLASGCQVDVNIRQTKTVNGIAGRSPLARSATTFFGLSEQPGLASPAYDSAQYKVTGNTVATAHWTMSASVASAASGFTELRYQWTTATIVPSEGSVAIPATSDIVVNVGATRCAARGVGFQESVTTYARHRLVIAGVEQYTRWKNLGTTGGVCQL